MYIPKVFIIVLNWNGVKDTLECLESILNLSYPNFEPVVVDNGSTDNSVEVIRARFPAITMVESKKNLGYTGGNNLGIQYSVKHGADYVWVLNNDTILENDCLKFLVDAAEDNSKIGILSPIIYYNDQRDKIQFCGAFINSREGRIVEESKNGKDKIANLGGYYFALYGTAILIKRKVIEKIGWFDETFFAYFEDYDYSLRANLNNFQCKVVDIAKIYHKDASSTGGAHSPTRTYYYYRNSILLWKKHLKKTAFLKFLYRHIRMSIGAAAFYVSGGNQLSGYACLDGIWDGLKGIGGPKKPENAMPIYLKTAILFFHHCGKNIKHLWLYPKSLVNN